MPPLRFAAAIAGTWAAMGAHAAQFELVYTGTFTTTEALTPATASAPAYFSGPTAYTLRSFFDTASPNLAPPLPGPFAGFRAYAPSSTTIDILGTTYSVEASLVNATAGVTVAIFDRNSFTPGRYGIGVFADPVHDGGGIVGDFASASTDFTAGNLVATTFTDYRGVGHSSGVCLQGSGGNCTLNAVTPWVLHAAGSASYALTFGNFEQDYPGGPLNTAQIVAVPEPATVGLLLAGLAGVGARVRRRR